MQGQNQGIGACRILCRHSAHPSPCTRCGGTNGAAMAGRRRRSEEKSEWEGKGKEMKLAIRELSDYYENIGYEVFAHKTKSSTKQIKEDNHTLCF